VTGVADALEFRPVGENDLPLLYRLTSDPAMAGEHEWFGWRDPREFPRQWAENGLLSDDGGILIVARGAERLGLVSWRKIPTGRSSYCWEIGIALAPDARGHGHGTHAQHMLVRYLFAHTLANRIQAGTELTNIAEQRALEKAGFTREGVLRGTVFRDGAWRDGVLYSILRHEAAQDTVHKAAQERVHKAAGIAAHGTSAAEPPGAPGAPGVEAHEAGGAVPPPRDTGRLRPGRPARSRKA
jgi:RimJ/RimL family protein N-acetyltransferase